MWNPLGRQEERSSYPLIGSSRDHVTNPYLLHVIITFEAGSLNTPKSTAFVAVHSVSNNQEPDPSPSWHQNLKVSMVISNASFATSTFAVRLQFMILDAQECKNHRKDDKCRTRTDWGDTNVYEESDVRELSIEERGKTAYLI